mgnify:CR=1 FL=1
MDYGQHADPKTKGCFHTLVSLVTFVATVLVLVFLVNTFVARAYTIPSGSMQDTIAIGDRVWSEKITYYIRDIQPGDVVTFDDPTTSTERTLIKRVIAVEGQTVDLIDGTVFVDGVALDEPYVQDAPTYPLDTMPGIALSYPYTVPEGTLWVMGDNREHSADSRYFGAVDADSVSGRAICIYWPIDHIGVL